MKRVLWTVAAIPVVLLLLAVGLSGYYIHTLSFNERTMCATGEPAYAFLPPACRAYISVFYSGETPEDREKMSASISFLISGYTGNEENTIGGRSLAMVDLLIERGADVNFVDQRGATPLHEAVFFGSSTLVKFLLDHGADPNKHTFITDTGDTLSPLELAIKIKKEGNKDWYGDIDWDGIISLLKVRSQKKQVSLHQH